MELKNKNIKISGNILIIILIFVNLVVETSVDIYVPALPNIRDEFLVSEAYLNNTMLVFILFSAITVLIMAPISDKFGRKPLMIISSTFFTLGSLLCMICPCVELLILARILQAIGMGGILANSTSIVQESFSKKSIKMAVSLLQSLVLIGPLMAPFIGTAILSVSTWRNIFLFLAILGGINVFLSFFLPETKPTNTEKKQDGSIKYLFKRKQFICIIAVLAVSGIPYYALVGVFSYICLEYFGLSYMDYNILYAIACAVSIVSPFIYQMIAKKLSNAKIFALTIISMFISVLSMSFFGMWNAHAFIVAFLPYILSEGIIRPLSFVILLDQPKEHVSTASSITNFAYSSITAFASAIAMLPIFPNYIVSLIAITAATMVISAIFLTISKLPIKK